MKVVGTVRVPGDKSISHRALIFSALATGRSRVRRILDSADVNSTAGVLRAYGVRIPRLGDDIAIEGVGVHGFGEPAAALDCGNSGTTTRLVAGLAAAYAFPSRFVGDASLSRRPMRRIKRPLEAMGAHVELEGGRDGLPMTIRGGDLHPVEWTSEVASAQVKSAILLAGLAGGVRAVVHEPAPTRDHTERMLRALGATVQGSEGTVALDPPRRLPPLDIQVPGDPSSAAFFAGLAAMADAADLTLPGVCVDDARTGAFEALVEMGAVVLIEPEATQGGEDVGTIRVRPHVLNGITIGGEQIPRMIDEIPLLACVASRADGETVITGAAELRVKESDRIRAVVDNLRALGADAEELPDGMRIVGSRRPLRGRVTTHGDHRLAMAFGVLGAVPGNEIEIDDRGCVAVSYPGFWEDLRQVTER